MTDSWHGEHPGDRPYPALELEGVTVEQAGRLVLDSVSFSVAPETTVAVAGAPGFGGAALARVVAGGVQPVAGAVRLAGENVTGLPPYKRKVGYVPAGGGLLPHLTAEQNIRYGARLRREPKRLADEHVDAAVEALELRPALDLRPHELSATQRLRVAIARVAARRPQPSTWVVDATADGPAQSLATGVHRAHLTGKPTILICATDRHHGAELGDAERLLILWDGQITADGRLDAFRADPADLLTARLALPAPLPVHAGRTVVYGIECGSLELPKPEWLHTGERVRVALPAEALSITKGGGKDILTTVVDVKPEGARSKVIVEPRQAPGERWPVRCDSGERPQLRQPVWVRVDRERILVFHADSGRRRREGAA